MSSSTTSLLAPYAGPFGPSQAAHLLRRCTFGVLPRDVENATAAGLAKTIDRLTTLQAESDDFRRADQILRSAALLGGAIGNLKAWWLHRMLHSANPLFEKMTLCWMNHFATSNAKVKSTAAMEGQYALARKHALGSFAEMLHGIAKDPAMVKWLDGNDNRKRAANENFARELMELFSLGIGAYSEKDIQQAARAFTGWHVRADKFFFDASQHDNGSKTVFGRSGNLDGGDVVDLCLQRPACSQFIAKKIVRCLVTDNPTPALLAAVADRLVQQKMQIGPVVRELLASQCFFSADANLAIIKSPVDFAIGALYSLGIERPNLDALSQFTARLGQDLFEPPTVKGWEGGRNWIDSSTLLLRGGFVVDLMEGKRYGTPTDSLMERLLSNADVSGDVADQVKRLAQSLLGQEPATNVIGPLVAYAEKTRNHGQRIKQWASLIMSLPEYQLL